MNQRITTAIILTRTNYGEADRIITVLTPDSGKLRLIAKGVRRVKSKLAGGIELFSVSQITYIPGRGEIGTLASTRLIKYYRHIINDIGRTMLGYELIKQLHKATEDEPEPIYFELLEDAFAALDDPDLPIELVQSWFIAQLLRINGHIPNLITDTNGIKLDATKTYEFDFEASSFFYKPDGIFAVDNIKFLRLLFSGNNLKTLAKVANNLQLVEQTRVLILALQQMYVQQ